MGQELRAFEGPDGNVRYERADGAGSSSAGALTQIARSGMYLSSGGPSGTVSTGQNILLLAPIIVPRALTVIEANINVTTLAASNVLRGGIYDDDGTGIPRTLLYEFPSTFDASATGQKTQAITLAFPSAGIYWVGGALQGGSGAGFTQVAPTPSNMIVDQAAAAGTAFRGYGQTGVSGALPATFTLTNKLSGVPLITLKVQ